MKKLLLILLLVAHVGLSQTQWNTKDSVARGVSVTVGTGISHYINSLQIDPSRIGMTTNFSCSSFKFMWEPEHRLSLGIETGYYRIYEVQLIEGNAINMASLSVTPILFCVQMRVFKHFFLSTATGVSIHHSLVNALGNQSESKTWAFSNLQLSAGYVYPITKQLGVGLQLKLLSENKTEDLITSLQAVVRYQFKRRYKRLRVVLKR